MRDFIGLGYSELTKDFRTCEGQQPSTLHRIRPIPTKISVKTVIIPTHCKITVILSSSIVFFSEVIVESILYCFQEFLIFSICCCFFTASVPIVVNSRYYYNFWAIT
ncbi:hypothetical protein PHYBLDRAFT_70195 [Phycomyces blakesleeanus NRRL 1555(-)]|uniref:Uncharacterized protein n=1 Tax=Phycomyces blakesleeanus (strain ATCC 8743b / DSM 1359 / FGSC 10004 / NBRC 33097 / NRRL 1555) TaxID=763407 RepID=A0A162T7X4_PHYB8|nr:hypothetical protein PHYBLDRAFT_70195 [Phycomyces blakesleeanus NRRL 1555(-)]OAD66812.1 hypothetical protein PHYBLDRAFT_70195 [Phycomyces blakesleeanus NRRL 1555(-)]|eukprot:XP_018284852.1 hypothetical protein PHYBLDRAFT_70195 [Phycomyces blakesleeanus NRRL 1555(-)]